MGLPVKARFTRTLPTDPRHWCGRSRRDAWRLSGTETSAADQDRRDGALRGWARERDASRTDRGSPADQPGKMASERHLRPLGHRRTARGSRSTARFGLEAGVIAESGPPTVDAFRTAPPRTSIAVPAMICAAASVLPHRAPELRHRDERDVADVRPGAVRSDGGPARRGSADTARRFRGRSAAPARRSVSTASKVCAPGPGASGPRVGVERLEAGSRRPRSGPDGGRRRRCLHRHGARLPRSAEGSAPAQPRVAATDWPEGLHGAREPAVPRTSLPASRFHVFLGVEVRSAVAGDPHA
jgi:hypothetical protein